MESIELLAPAGSLEAFHAALQNGADAVYLGGQHFNARAYASNFSIETLKDAVEQAHIRGMKVYVTVNTLIKDEEVPELMAYVQQLYEINVDALIIQDLGIFTLIRQAYPDFELHCSTQMALHNKQGVHLLKEMGAKRVVLAREMSLKEISAVKDNTGMELEVFVHGALCVSYSGQCLMSSFIGGRSGNRGRCAQPCRRAYEMVNKAGHSQLPNQYYLSMRDLNTLDQVGELIEAGVTSFKIEGRMKRPEYVASIVGAYRKAIDLYLASQKSFQNDQVQEEMAQLFNRRFTKGHLFSRSQNELVNVEKPNNRGIFLGTITQILPKSNGFCLQLLTPLSLGDGIEIWQGVDSDRGGLVSKILLKGEAVKRAEEGQTVELAIKGKVAVGDQVYKTLDKELMERLGKTYVSGTENRKIPLSGMITLKLGVPIQLTFQDHQGNLATQTTAVIPEKALKVALTQERVAENISKLGNTPYELTQLQVHIESGLSVPIAALNGLRREAIDALSVLRADLYPQRQQKRQPAVLLDFPTLKQQCDLAPPQMTVKVDRLDQLRAALNSQSIGCIYYSDPATLIEAVAACEQKRVPIFFKSPNILSDDALVQLEQTLQKAEPAGILAGEIGILKYFQKSQAYQLRADYTINMMNSHSIRSISQLGTAGITLSLELDLKALKQLRVDPALETEAVIYGRIPLMTTAYCPLQHERNCGQSCDHCRLSPYTYDRGLKDQKQVTFPYGKDAWGKTIILNSQILSMVDKLEEFKQFRIHYLRAEFTDESPEEVRSTLQVIDQQIGQVFRNKTAPPAALAHLHQQFTRGHYYRGVE